MMVEGKGLREAYRVMRAEVEKGDYKPDPGVLNGLVVEAVKYGARLMLGDDAACVIFADASDGDLTRMVETRVAGELWVRGSGE